MDGGEANQFPFFPNVHEPFNPEKANGLIRKFTFDMGKSDNRYQVDTIFPGVSGALARQDDRHHTVPFRWGFINSFGPGGGGWTVMDLQTMQSRRITVPDYSLSEMTFVPRRPDAPEGDGYLIGIGSSAKEAGRSDLVLIDLAAIDAGPVARVKMPFKVVGQVHGFWADASAIPGADVA
jgi:carotenoid cleavage dioxygenase